MARCPHTSRRARFRIRVRQVARRIGVHTWIGTDFWGCIIWWCILEGDVSGVF